MSFTNLPTNVNGDAVLVRGAKPDFITLASASAPAPSAAEAGAIWEHSDTGDRFRWSSTAWVQTGAKGGSLARDVMADFYTLSTAADPAPATGQEGVIWEHIDTGDRFRWSGTTWITTGVRGADLPANYFIEAADLNIIGTNDVFQTGTNLDVSNTVYETLWNHTGDVVHLSSATQLYISSSSASDTDQPIRVCGLDTNHDVLEIEATLNGQTQVAIPGGLYRAYVREAEVQEGSVPVGDIYVAESDAAPGGVPAAAKVKAKISLALNDSGEFASNGVSQNGFFTVPQKSDVFIIGIFPTVPKDDEITIEVWTRTQDKNWEKIFTIFNYAGSAPISVPSHTRIRNKSDVQLRVLSANANGQVSVNLQLLYRRREI